jgi:hypothetical protein
MTSTITASLLTRYWYCDNLPLTPRLVSRVDPEISSEGRYKCMLNISLSGVGEGKKALTISREEVYLAMRRDLGRIRGHLLQAKL